MTERVEWTILLRARDRNGNAGGIARTTVAAAGTPVPAVPAAWLGVQALLLLWCRRRRGRVQPPRASGLSNGSARGTVRRRAGRGTAGGPG